MIWIYVTICKNKKFEYKGNNFLYLNFNLYHISQFLGGVVATKTTVARGRLGLKREVKVIRVGVSKIRGGTLTTDTKIDGHVSYIN